MNFDNAILCHICSFVVHDHPQALSLSIFGVCSEWRTALCGAASAPFWQRLFHARFPRFLQPVSPSKKRNVSAVAHDYRKLYLYTSAILQFDSSSFNPAKSTEFEDPVMELAQDTTRYRSELMESIALRLFSKKFSQFAVYNRHHLLYGPAGCGKASLIESLARIWGSHIITIQYPTLVKVSTLIDWSGYVDILCSYVLAFCESTGPIIVHLRHMSQLGTPSTQNSLNSLLKNIPISNIWVIGTTSLPNTAIVQHSDLLAAKLYIPFPSPSDRETFLKYQLLPSPPSPSPPSAPSPAQPRITTLSLSPAPPSSSSASLDSSPCAPAVSAQYVHLLALRTPNFTYADLRALCATLKSEFMRGDQKSSLPFIKLMDVLAKAVPFYKPEDAKRYELTDPTLVTQTTEKRRLSFG